MTNPDITIEDVHLQLDKSGRYMEGKVQVTITLKNNSKTATYYMFKRPRDIDYDKDSHTLSIGLYEKDLPQDVKVSSGPIEPEQVALLPDTIFHWEYLLPLWVKKITRPAGLKEIVEVLNISGAQKVVCTVAYHTSPFRVNPSIEGEAVPGNLSKWGKTVSASFAGTLIDGILSFRIF
jgi:hypothetical protein